MEKTVKTMLILGVAVLVLLVLAFTSVGCVGPGHRGVLVNMGRVDMTELGEGVYFKKPFIQSVVEMDIRTGKIESETEASSKDLQIVTTKAALNASLNPSSAAEVYATIGPDYQDRIIAPAVSEALKQSTATFTAEELITKRSEAKSKVLQVLRDRLTPLGVIVEDISITNFQFSKSFNQAIEEKVTAEQLKLKADRDLERFRTEAQQVEVKAIGEKKASIAKAEGEAQSIKIVSEQLRVSPQYVDWMQVNRWDGKLPSVTGGATPFIQVKP